jgi:hypothetical protein
MRFEIYEKYLEGLRQWFETHRPRLTEQYKTWEAQSELLYERFRGRLRDFEKENLLQEGLRIQTEESASALRICVYDDFVPQDAAEVWRAIEGKVQPSDALTSRLQARQRAMKIFTEFLKLKLQTNG